MLTDPVKNPRQGEELSVEALNAYFQQTGKVNASVKEVKQFPGGYSNLTYLLRMTDGQELVLRRPPRGAQAKGGHDMGREFKTLSLLKTHFQKAPRAVLFCEDESVIGVPFFVMERLTGYILRNRVPESMNLETMRTISAAAIDTLVELHAIPLEGDLLTLGKPNGYVQRQVTGWAERYKAAETDSLPGMDFLGQWLLANIPDEQAPTIIHNDFKYDNLVLNADRIQEVIGVLDWEMATIGDPLMDLGVMLAYWAQHGDNPYLAGLSPTSFEGNMSRREVAERYAKLSGRDLRHLVFYYAFGCFKIGVICQQIYKRYKLGLTTDERFGALLYVTMACAANGKKAIDSDEI